MKVHHHHYPGLPLLNAGWWYTYTPLKNMTSSVGITIPNIWKVIKFHGSSHHQPVHDCHLPINFMKIMVIFYSYVNLYLRASLPMAIQGIQGSVSSPLPPSYRLQPRQWMFFLVNGG